MTSVRRAVRQKLAAGELDASSLLTEVKGIGLYLAQRIARALRLAHPITIGEFWNAARSRSTAAIEATLHRALQNERGNQCVSTRIVGERDRTTYHTGDINVHGYEACVTLLDHLRTRQARRVRFGALPLRLPTRSMGSKHCGCRTRAECTGPCTLLEGDVCVPRAHNARGFVGVSPHPGQREHAPTERQRQSVRRRARTRVTAALRNDPASAHDIAVGHARILKYSPRGSTMWRRPGSKVRLPARVR